MNITLMLIFSLFSILQNYIWTMKRSISIIFILFFSIGALAQIQSGTIEPEKKKEKANKSEEETEIEKKNENTVIIDGEEYTIKKKKKKEKRFNGPLPTTGRFIYASGAPFWTSSFFTPDYDGQFQNRSEETPKWAFSTEVGMKVNIKPFLQVGVGFSYSQYKMNYTYAKPDTVNIDTAYSYDRIHQYIGIPIRLNMIHGKGKFKFFYGVTALPSMQLNQIQYKNYTTSEGQVVQDEKSVNKNSISAFQLIVGGFLGAEYHFSDNFSAFVSPEFRYNITNTNYNMRFKNNLYGLAIRIGIQLQL